ncbi:MAG: STAS domain-containing protein [Candidatus Korobacteraceae bacterium]
MLRVDIQSAPGMVTLRCSGRIVLGVEAETLRCMVTSRAEEVLVLDLRGVHAVDAAGLGLLVELCSWAQRRNSVLAIANPSRRVHKLIAMTRLHSVLRMADFATWDDAFEHDTPGCCAMTA